MPKDGENGFGQFPAGFIGQIVVKNKVLVGEPPGVQAFHVPGQAKILAGDQDSFILPDSFHSLIKVSVVDFVVRLKPQIMLDLFHGLLGPGIKLGDQNALLTQILRCKGIALHRLVLTAEQDVRRLHRNQFFH